MVYLSNIWESYSKTLKNVTKKRQSLKYALMVNDFWEMSMSNSCQRFIILISVIQSASFLHLKQTLEEQDRISMLESGHYFFHSGLCGIV